MSLFPDVNDYKGSVFLEVTIAWPCLGQLETASGSSKAFWSLIKHSQCILGDLASASIGAS